MTFPLATLDPAITYTNEKKNAYHKDDDHHSAFRVQIKGRVFAYAAVPAAHCGCASENKRSLISM